MASRVVLYHHLSWRCLARRSASSTVSSSSINFNKPSHITQHKPQQRHQSPLHNLITTHSHSTFTTNNKYTSSSQQQQFDQSSSSSSQNLEQLIQSIESSPTLPPTTSLLTLFHNLSRSHPPSLTAKYRAKLTERLLAKIIETDITLTTPEMFHYAITAWSSTKSRYGAHRALDILRLMHWESSSSLKRRRPRSNNNESLTAPRPDPHHYATVLHALCTHAGKDGIFKASSLLDNMMDGNEATYPDVVCYNTVMAGWSRIGDPLRAEELLQRLRSSDDVAPDATSFQTVIAAWSRLGTRDGARRALGLLEDTMERRRDETECEEWCFRPDRITFNAVIHGCAKTGDPTTCERLLDRMYAIRDARRVPQQHGRREVDVTPNTITYNSVAYGWALKGNVSRVERLLERMSKMTVPADTITYNTLLHAHVRRGGRDEGRKTERILEDMKRRMGRLAPNVRTYGSVIDAWGRSDDPEGARRALALLQELQNTYDEAYRSGRVHEAEMLRPTVICFHGVIAAFARRGNAREAHAVLDIAEDLADTRKDLREGVRPNKILYNIVLNAWAQAPREEEEEEGGEIENHKKAFHLLKKMERLGRKYIQTRPNVKSFNHVMEACVLDGIEDKDDAVAVAMDVYERLCKTRLINEESYQILLKVLMANRGNLSSLSSGDAKDDVMVVERVFRCCCERGLLNENLLTQFKEFFSADGRSEEGFRKLFGDEHKDNRDLTVMDLPREWSRNVVRPS